MSKGTRRTIIIPQIGRVPAIQMSEAWRETVTLASGRNVPGMFADMLQLRTTNPVGPDGQPQEVRSYLLFSPGENLRFTVLRSEGVVGLDFDEQGDALTLDELEERRAVDIETQQATRVPAQRTFVPLIAQTVEPVEG